MKEINFLGLGFEVGQEQKGLCDSHAAAKHYFPFLKKQGLQIFDRGEVSYLQPGCEKIRNTDQVTKINWNIYAEAYATIAELLREPRPLLNWGGDHSVALATVGAFCKQYPEGSIVWIDAHADLNLPDYSLSGNLHGMPLSILLNLQGISEKYFPWLERFLSPKNLIYVGVRDLDPFEKDMIQKLGITAYTANDVARRGMAAISQEIYQRVKNRPLHVSFDIDSLSPEFAPSTGVPVGNGLTIEDLKILGETLSQHKQLTSLDVVEINPKLGNDEDVFQTYISALIFLRSTLYQGGFDDGIGRTIQTINAAPLEPRSQV